MQIKNAEAARRFQEMKTGMLLHTPFFASLMLDILNLKVGKFPGIPTAGTDGRNVMFDEDYLASLTLPEAVFLCCHEIGHCMWMHMDRGRRYMDTGFEGNKFLPTLFNVAADFVINDMLTQSKIGQMPKGGLLDPKYKGDMLVEDVYRDLYKRLPPPPPKGKGGSGKDEDEGEDDGSGGDQDGEGDGDGGIASKEGHGGKNPMDTHVYKPGKVAEAEMKRAVASAVSAAKAMGKMPGALERWVSEVLKPQVKWKDRLRHLVHMTVERETTTWASPHRRRLVTQKVYLPSYTGFACGQIVKVVDTSGSMGQREFDAAYAETAEILTTCRPRELHLMSCDAAVHSHHILNADDDIFGMKPELKGGGGTSFIPPFEKVEEELLEPAVLIYFTDGYGSFPDTPPPYPVIWVMTTDIKPPFGECVKVELSDYE